jgi:integrase
MATFKAEVQKQRKDGTFNIKILVTHNRQLKRLPTGIYITKDDMTRSGKIKNQKILDQIDGLIMRYRKKSNELSIAINNMSIDKLARYLCEPEVVSIDFLKVFQDYINENPDKKGLRNYKSALNSLVKFLGRNSLDISEITVPFLEKYAASLGKGRAVSLYLGSMRHVYSYAKQKYNDEDAKRILIPYSPFSRYKVPRQNVAEKKAISAELIRKIIELPYDATSRGKDKENRYNLAKDCFILSFSLIGTNSVDLYNAEIYGNDEIVYCRTKTKDRRSDKARIQIKVHPHILPIFKKYMDKTGKRVFRFYQMYADQSTFNAALNKGLKAVGKKAGIPDLKFYAARHSWATIARNDLKTDKSTIDEALNHIDKRLSVTDLYIKKDFSIINEVNKSVLDYVFKSRKPRKSKQ